MPQRPYAAALTLLSTPRADAGRHLADAADFRDWLAGRKPGGVRSTPGSAEMREQRACRIRADERDNRWSSHGVCRGGVRYLTDSTAMARFCGTGQVVPGSVQTGVERVFLRERAASMIVAAHSLSSPRSVFSSSCRIPDHNPASLQAVKRRWAVAGDVAKQDGR